MKNEKYLVRNIYTGLDDRNNYAGVLFEHRFFRWCIILIQMTCTQMKKQKMN